jgi:acylphosphatase
MRTEEHATDRPHNAPVRQRFRIRGTFVPKTYLYFVADRAAWLDIDGWAEARDGEAIVVAAGPEAMVGAFEMALMLGPLDALVRDFETFDELGPVGRGFSIHSASQFGHALHPQK